MGSEYIYIYIYKYNIIYLDVYAVEDAVQVVGPAPGRVVHPKAPLQTLHHHPPCQPHPSARRRERAGARTSARDGGAIRFSVV